jgi:predicted site-specific integrase-resolvase
MDPIKAAFGLDEWCDRWSISRGTAYNLAKKGKLRIIKILSRSFITAEEDTRFRQDREKAAPEEFAAASSKKRDAKTKADAGRAAALNEARAKISKQK